MSNKDGFAGGFIAGAVFGGVVGGVLGVLLSRRAEAGSGDEARLNARMERQAMRGKNRQLKEDNNMESARRSLEDKIAQLNDAIDDVRHGLQTVNGSAGMETERLPMEDI
ncbi:hypothetical protein NG798_10630 [Ancylothrix sp. C2]|uniref:hypothetical protein n=1 Tax=Ancylothrix sp. D3o TaxID=2953691 RepID=UPI0021BA88EE|nr:hypothetical protein [Ancylothrix sp. D3o]MCT7950243.1 hypothetical protein [Ancylothrix sp. D3o]